MAVAVVWISGKWTHLPKQSKNFPQSVTPGMNGLSEASRSRNDRVGSSPSAVSVWLFATDVTVAAGIPSPWLRHRDVVCLAGLVRTLWRKHGLRFCADIAKSARWPRPAARTEFMQTKDATRHSMGIVLRPWKLAKIRLQSSAFAHMALAEAEARTMGANAARLSNQGVARARHRGICAQA
jgi:hypothetical protein